MTRAHPRRLTTLRLGGPAREVVLAHDEQTLIEAVREADEAGTPVLVVGGGSNLVVADEGYAGRVVVVRHGGLRAEGDTCGGAFVEVGAGEPWDDVVAAAVENGWIGVEALSGIPGTAGATPIQNVGAYGQEIAQTRRQGPHVGPRGRPGAHLRRRRLRLRLPDQPVQAGARAGTWC